MKYGEKLYYHDYWWLKIKRYPQKSFRFRIDPVPCIGNYKGWFGQYYKRPKTTQERKLFYAYPDYVRGKRSSCNLPNAWDDYLRGDVKTRKSWKNRKIKKQYMKHIG